MSRTFDTLFSELPKEIPLFPLARVILLPRVQLPLNIFEPRYIAMVEQAMATRRLIGIIQPASGNDLFRTGCAGRIISLAETEDGRYLITLKGVCRFNIGQEKPLSSGGFRVAEVDWQPYAGDMTEEKHTDICRDTMMKNLEGYLHKMNMICDQWDKVKNVGCEHLISTLSVVCPFTTEEKQKLLEAKDTAARATLLQQLMAKAIPPKQDAMEEKTCH